MTLTPTPTALWFCFLYAIGGIQNGPLKTQEIHIMGRCWRERAVSPNQQLLYVRSLFGVRASFGWNMDMIIARHAGKSYHWIVVQLPTALAAVWWKLKWLWHCTTCCAKSRSSLVIYIRYLSTSCVLCKAGNMYIDKRRRHMSDRHN